MADPKVIVITGASSGIGAALAQHLGAGPPDGERARLALSARREPELRETARAAGGETIAIPGDMTRREDVERLRDEAIRTFGHVDVWINNVGRGISRSVFELTDADVDEMIAVNVKSALYGMQAIVPHFKERGRGHLINVSSFLSRVPVVTFRAAYSASKAALNALTANARMELAGTHPGIDVSLVMPGIVTTDFHRHARHGTPSFGSGAPPPGAQNADEVAAAIVALIARPVAEIYTNPQQAAVVVRYYGGVAAFERELAAQAGGR